MSCGLVIKRVFIIPSGVCVCVCGWRVPVERGMDVNPKLRSKTWVTTLRADTADDCKCLEAQLQRLTVTGDARFIAYSKEAYPDAAAWCYRVYVVFHASQQVSRCFKFFGKGHRFQPIKVPIRKDESYRAIELDLCKIGDEPRQGARRDLVGWKSSRPIQLDE